MDIEKTTPLNPGDNKKGSGDKKAESPTAKPAAPAERVEDTLPLNTKAVKAEPAAAKPAAPAANDVASTLPLNKAGRQSGAAGS